MPTAQARAEAGAGAEAGGGPPVTVVVCTKDRPGLLDGCLEELGRVRYPRYEVLVVDNGSRDDRTSAVARRRGARVVREERPGLDNARNRGIADARYDLIAYVDDDVRVDPEWLSALARAFADPEVDAVTGLVLPLEQETPAQRLFESYGNGMRKGHEARVFRGTELSDEELIAVQHIGVGANMAARREVLTALGGFDPALDVGTPAGGGGDLDLFHRLLVAGRTIRYEPSAVVRHRHRRTMEELTRQLNDNGRAYGVYLLKVARRKTVPRRSVIGYALRTWWPWLLGRLALGLLGRHRLPVRLLWAEVSGALTSPAAFLSARRLARGRSSPTAGD